MRFGRLFILGSLLALGVAPATPVLADDPPAAEMEATSVATQAADPVRDLITRQMDAIRDRNAEQAFSYTTAGFHEHYGSAQSFLSRMRFEQRPLYNHKEYIFLDRHKIAGGGVLQKVKVQGVYDGEPVIVIFRLEPQPDGTWLIDSYSVFGNEADEDSKAI
jgi:hypothetical protein